MTQQSEAELLNRLDAIQHELTALKEDVGHMKRKLLVAEQEVPAPIWNERDRLAVIEFWRKNGRWSGLSDVSRRMLCIQLFGCSDAGKEPFSSLK